MLKKILIAASLVATLSANTAMAGTFVASTTTAPVFATEINGTGAAVLTPFTSTYTMASTPAASSAFNMVYTLTGATFGTALTSASLALSGAGVASIVRVSGGTVTDSTVTFRVDVTTALTTASVFTLTYTLTGTTGLATAAATVTLGVSLTDTLGAVDTAGTAASVASSAQGTTITGSAVSAGLIDVVTGSTLFTAASASTTSVVLGTFTIANGTAVEDDGTTAWSKGATDAVATSGSVVITGDFAASVGFDGDLSATTFDGVKLSGCTAFAAARNATSLTATTATFTLTNADIVAAAGACSVTMFVDGTTSINEQTATALVTIDYTNAAYVDESTSFSLFPLVKNGDTVDEDLVLTPGGAYSNLVRVSNKSAVTGKVIVTLYNDAGDTVTFDLTDGVLVGQASTGLVTVADLYAQAQAADATFEHNGGKLRARFEGEFSSIEAQSITVSTDGTTFSTF